MQHQIRHGSKVNRNACHPHTQETPWPSRAVTDGNGTRSEPLQHSRHLATAAWTGRASGMWTSNTVSRHVSPRFSAIAGLVVCEPVWWDWRNADMAQTCHLLNPVRKRDTRPLLGVPMRLRLRIATLLCMRAGLPLFRVDTGFPTAESGDGRRRDETATVKVHEGRRPSTSQCRV